MPYRLIIDFPIEEDLNKSIEIAKNFLENFKDFIGNTSLEITNIKYRLSSDLDRTPKNYLIINDNGHAATRKSEL